jgi:hypothetical protein
MENRRITVSIEFGYSDSFFGRTDMTDADLKAFAIDDFISDITKLCEEKDLRSYVQSSIQNNAFAINKS